MPTEMLKVFGQAKFSLLFFSNFEQMDANWNKSMVFNIR